MMRSSKYRKMCLLSTIYSDYFCLLNVNNDNKNGDKN